jgi:phosphoribosylformimino-5-aminoimidazole carboxamide ribotide isomerase
LSEGGIVLEIYPAVDILEGKCVRLRQGRYDQVTKYGNPVDNAKFWQDQGAVWLHVVDLDGAREGKPLNLKVLAKIIDQTDLKVQFGGGIRDMVILREVLSLGVSRAVMGTTIIKQPEIFSEACQQFSDQVVAGLDAKETNISVSGWQEDTQTSLLSVAKKVEALGVSRLVVTNIARDGTQTGPDLAGLKDLATQIAVPIIASGGVSSLKDIKMLKQLESLGIEGVIVGRALYEGTVNFKKAKELIEDVN